MADLKKIMFEKIMDSGEDDGLQYEVNLINHTFRSGKYETDKYNGICEDGDSKAVRYINHDNGGKVFKMKAGKFIRHLIMGNIIREDITGERNHLFAGMLRSGLAGIFLFHHNRRKTAYSWMTISGIFTIQTSAMETSTAA